MQATSLAHPYTYELVRIYTHTHTHAHTPNAAPRSFYPVDISFAASKTFCDIAVEGVTHTLRDQAPVRFTSKRQLVTTDYSVS